MEIKNYRINFMDGDHQYLTASQAAELFKVLQKGEKFFMVCGSIYAVHQVKNIKRIERELEISKYSELQDGIEKYLNTSKQNLLN